MQEGLKKPFTEDFADKTRNRVFVTKNKRTAKFYAGNNGKILELSIPTWKKELKPETFSEIVHPNLVHPTFNEIETRYIKGSKNFIPAYKELGGYFKHFLKKQLCLIK